MTDKEMMYELLKNNTYMLQTYIPSVQDYLVDSMIEGLKENGNRQLEDAFQYWTPTEKVNGKFI